MGVVSVLGVGIDLVDLDRIRDLYERQGDRFVSRFCRPDEVAERTGEALVQHLGGRFAAKEAVLKALGTGWAQGLGLTQVEVVPATEEGPRVVLHDAAFERAEALGVVRIHLSISHERGHAIALALLEGAS